MSLIIKQHNILAVTALIGAISALQLIPDINEISVKNTQGSSLHQVKAEAKAIQVHGSNILP